MRGINRVVFAGHVSDRMTFGRTGNGLDVCTFILASERPSNRGTLTACVKINVYIADLVAECRRKLEKGCYVLVEGELMNRDSPSGRATELRAWEVSFLGFPDQPPIRGAADDNRHDDPKP